MFLQKRGDFPKLLLITKISWQQFETPQPKTLHNQPVLQNFPPFLITSLRFSLLIILLSVGNYLEISRNIPTYHNFMLFCKGLFFPKQLSGIYFSIFLYLSVQNICKSEKKKNPTTFEILSSEISTSCSISPEWGSWSFPSGLSQDVLLFYLISFNSHLISARLQLHTCTF